MSTASFRAIMPISMSYSDSLSADISEASSTGVTDLNCLASAVPDMACQPPLLTQRESKLLCLLLRGLPVRLIAYQLRVTGKTARTYIYALTRKLGASDRAALLSIGRTYQIAPDHGTQAPLTE